MKKYIQCAIYVIVGMMLSNGVNAQDYPDKTKSIKIIVPTGGGSAVDLLSRSLSKSLSDSQGINSFIENKPGAELAIGVNDLIKSPNDGYTLMVTSSSSQTLSPVLIPHFKINTIEDYSPVLTISRAGLVMNLGLSTNKMSAKEIIDDAKKNPGKYTCATASTNQRMACELLKSTAGIDVLIVPYKTTAAAMTALGGGEVDIVFVDAGSARAGWMSGRMRGAAVTTEDRLEIIKDVPTFKEIGVDGFNMFAWYAIYSPKGVEPTILKKLQDAFIRAKQTEDFKQALHKYGMENLDMRDKEIDDMTRSEIARWQKVKQEQKISLN